MTKEETSQVSDDHQFINETMKKMHRCYKSMSSKQCCEYLNPMIEKYNLIHKEVAVVFDTSYLMLKPGHAGWAYIELISKLPAVQFKPIVPKEIQEILFEHLKTNNNELAQIARKRVRSLIRSPFFFQPSLAEVSNQVTSPKSVVKSILIERQLIAYSQSLAQNSEIIVFLATLNDERIIEVQEPRSSSKSLYLLNQKDHWFAIVEVLLRNGWSDEFLCKFATIY